MQFKPIPEPPSDLETVGDVRAATPLPAESRRNDIDCCARLIDETHIRSRDDAGDWLTFLRALELVRSEPHGYVRTSEGRSPPTLRERFRERVYGSAAVLDVLEEHGEPLDARAVVERTEDRSSGDAGARDRNSTNRREFDRTERILEWAVLLGAIERVEGKQTGDSDDRRPRYRTLVSDR
ncbi:hypothetical protein [Natrarchaeobius halalkaliphilus]|uniref:hypothetical protein n=1 Tax=Natrarchaeobius halalkaliphilus TaxID=1679091 RepID=UPI001A9FBB99|nr:hypothetical protein [Natrarchaeobius halalkaliphilus]